MTPSSLSAITWAKSASVEPRCSRGASAISSRYPASTISGAGPLRILASAPRYPSGGRSAPPDTSGLRGGADEDGRCPTGVEEDRRPPVEGAGELDQGRHRLGCEDRIPQHALCPCAHFRFG